MLYFDWDPEKEWLNIQKHGVDFRTAMLVFSDPNCRIVFDDKHSVQEQRFFCFGKAKGAILTVRFTYQGGVIRIFGAGYWKKGRGFYEEKKEV